METQVLRKSKLYACFYGDAVAEKDFYVKNIKVLFEEEKATFSLEIMRSLDSSLFEEVQEDFDTFIFEDTFFTRKTFLFLKKHEELKYFQLEIKKKTSKKYRIRRIAFKKGKVELFVFN